MTIFTDLTGGKSAPDEDTQECCMVDPDEVGEMLADLIEVAGDTMHEQDIYNIDLTLSFGPCAFSASLYSDAIG